MPPAPIPDPSPLATVERRVQERAAAVALDMDAAGAADALRHLISDEIDRWTLDHKRGLEPVPLADPRLVAERAYRNLAGYGPLEALLADDDVWEIMVG
jgi:hypothetical protein